MNFIIQHKSGIARVITLVVFLALIRCIAEPFRLNAMSDNGIIFSEIIPFLWGALSAASFLLVMVIFSFWNKSIPVIILGLLAIATLVALKIYFNI